MNALRSDSLTTSTKHFIPLGFFVNTGIQRYRYHLYWWLEEIPDMCGSYCAASPAVAVSVAATGLRRNELHRNAIREKRKAWLSSFSAASAVGRAKNKHEPCTTVITTHHYSSCLHRTADNSENSRARKPTTSDPTTSIAAVQYFWLCFPVCLPTHCCGGREERKSTLPPWPTPFGQMHQRKRPAAWAKLPFSREHSPALKALLLSLHWSPWQSSSGQSTPSPPRKSPHLARHLDERAEQGEQEKNARDYKRWHQHGGSIAAASCKAS